MGPLDTKEKRVWVLHEREKKKIMKNTFKSKAFKNLEGVSSRDRHKALRLINRMVELFDAVEKTDPKYLKTVYLFVRNGIAADFEDVKLEDPYVKRLLECLLHTEYKERLRARGLCRQEKAKRYCSACANETFPLLLADDSECVGCVASSHWKPKEKSNGPI
jgi:hypothetical protein